MSSYFGAYGVLGVLVAVGVVLGFAMMAANWLFRPNQPNPEKLTTYECGVDPVGEGWSQTQVRYYVYAFVYVIFAVESVFLFPWSTVFAVIGAISLVEMLVFVAILAVALLYAYKKRVLTWV